MSDGVGAEIQFLKGLREKTVPSIAISKIPFDPSCLVQTSGRIMLLLLDPPQISEVKVLKNPTDDSSVAIFRFRKYIDKSYTSANLWGL